MKQTLCRAAFRAWPFSFAHVTLMGLLNPPLTGKREVTTKLRRYGLKFSYDPDSYIGQFIFYRGIFEEAILRKIEQHLNPGDTFVDIGANIGLHSVVASKLVGPKGQVVAFEPAAAARARLAGNLALNQISNVTVHGSALGRAEGEAKLYNLDPTNDGQATLAYAPNARSEHVKVQTLDSLGLCPNVMKIDVEGAEMEVLSGGVNTLKYFRPVLFLECIDQYLRKFGSSSKDLFTFLRDHGYSIRTLRRSSWVPADAAVDCDLIALPS